VKGKGHKPKEMPRRVELERQVMARMLVTKSLLRMEEAQVLAISRSKIERVTELLEDVLETKQVKLLEVVNLLVRE
jgi:hypothetical protein